jgi:hypothetical protein
LGRPTSRKPTGSRPPRRAIHRRGRATATTNSAIRTPPDILSIHTPGEVAIQDGFEEATTIRRIRGGLYLEGGGPRLELRRVVDPAAIAARAMDLAGEWRVAERDDKRIDKPYAVALSVDHEHIWWEPACASQYRPYTIQGSRFDTDPVNLSGREVCDIRVPDELARIWSAMDAADTIQRTPANGVSISGNGRSVTLFSQ